MENRSARQGESINRKGSAAGIVVSKTSSPLATAPRRSSRRMDWCPARTAGGCESRPSVPAPRANRGGALVGRLHQAGTTAGDHRAAHAHQLRRQVVHRPVDPVLARNARRAGDGDARNSSRRVGRRRVRVLTTSHSPSTDWPSSSATRFSSARLTRPADSDDDISPMAIPAVCLTDPHSLTRARVAVRWRRRSPHSGDEAALEGAASAAPSHPGRPRGPAPSPRAQAPRERRPPTLPRGRAVLSCRPGSTSSRRRSRPSGRSARGTSGCTDYSRRARGRWRRCRRQG